MIAGRPEIAELVDGKRKNISILILSGFEERVCVIAYRCFIAVEADRILRQIKCAQKQAEENNQDE